MSTDIEATGKTATTAFPQSPLIMVATGVAVTILAAAVYLFAGSLYKYGIKGTAAIYDVYANGLPYCL